MFLFTNKSRLFKCFIVVSGNPRIIYSAMKLLFNGHLINKRSIYSDFSNNRSLNPLSADLYLYKTSQSPFPSWQKTSMIMYLGENTQKTERTVFRIITGVNEVTYKMARAIWAVFAGRFWFLLPFGLKLFYISAKLKYF